MPSRISQYANGAKKPAIITIGAMMFVSLLLFIDLFCYRFNGKNFSDKSKKNLAKNSKIYEKCITTSAVFETAQHISRLIDNITGARAFGTAVMPSLNGRQNCRREHPP